MSPPPSDQPSSDPSSDPPSQAPSQAPGPASPRPVGGPAVTAADFNTRAAGRLPGYLGIEVVEIEPGRSLLRLPVKAELLAPNGYLHAASVVALADTSAGFGCSRSLPEGAAGFTTIELKANFLGTLTEGALRCVATLVHGGRTTQLWDASATDEATGRLIAVFRCTQLILRPRVT